jgi:hypothetical protein
MAEMVSIGGTFILNNPRMAPEIVDTIAAPNKLKLTHLLNDVVTAIDTVIKDNTLLELLREVYIEGRAVGNHIAEAGNNSSAISGEPRSLLKDIMDNIKTGQQNSMMLTVGYHEHITASIVDVVELVELVLPNFTVK